MAYIGLFDQLNSMAVLCICLCVCLCV